MVDFFQKSPSQMLYNFSFPSPLPSRWLRKFFKTRLLECSIIALSHPFYPHYGRIKFSKITFSWLFPLLLSPLLKILFKTHLGCSRMALFPTPLRSPWSKEIFSNHLHRCSGKAPLPPPQTSSLLKKIQKPHLLRFAHMPSSNISRTLIDAAQMPHLQWQFSYTTALAAPCFFYPFPHPLLEQISGAPRKAIFSKPDHD